jgi:hypothetical protein
LNLKIPKSNVRDDTLGTARPIKG